MSDALNAIAALSPEKRELLLLRLKAKAARTNIFPLSFAQQRLWLFDQFDPGNILYNVPAAVRLHGPLDVSVFERCLNEVIRRHEVLRTTFTVVDGTPMQVIAPLQQASLVVEDTSELPEVERSSVIEHRVFDEARRPFDLSTGPLLRSILIKAAADEHVLLLTMHHIVSDQWSRGLLIREIAELYEAFVAGRPSPLKDLPIQYADFAVWQRQQLQGSKLEEQLEYWKERLAGSPAMLNLPTDRPRPAMQSFAGACHSFVIEKDLADGLKQLAQQEGATVFMAVLAAYQTLLHRYSGQSEIVIGTPVAGRSRKETEQLIGFFINTLMMRTDFSGDPTFRELMSRVREVALGAYQHQDVPFEKLVEVLQPERTRSYSPLFQATLTFLNTPMEDAEVHDLSMRSIEADTGVTNYDLMLFIRDSPRGLNAMFKYNTDLFDAGTIDRMEGHLRTLISALVAQRDERVSALTMLSRDERQQILVEWNQTATSFPRDSCVHELFESQVARLPDASAAVFGEDVLTYAELNRRANKLAAYLRRIGVGPEVLVGICAENSPHMLIGMLGILKAGGAYVPLDPSYPLERLDFMIEDAGVAIVLTQDSLAATVPSTWVQLISLDGDWETIDREEDNNQASSATAQNLAYVIYTSGSTGTPKGISITHRAINRLVFNTNYIDLNRDDRVAHASNSSFDAATFEIWGPLLQGATIIAIPRDVSLSPNEFARRILDQKVTTLFLTTALFNQIAQIAPEAFASLTTVLFGGEAVDPHWVREIVAGQPPERLLHVYGPTESTTFATWYRVLDVPIDAITVPIGAAISNTQTYLLDKHIAPVATGIAGELYIGGEGLARGYLRHPELTAEFFVPDPFSSEPGQRLYRTGDVGRHRSDGSIEFLGRVDYQVKVRGFRIELGEIESALRSHSYVRDNVVLAREDLSGERQLVAYIVGDKEGDLTANDLRRYLSEKLPDYMVPHAFVFLDELPLNTNLKVDRHALPAPEHSREELAEDFVAPTTSAEEILAGIWSQVLGVERVGVDDNYFSLGGDSIRAIQVLAKSQDRGLNYNISELFELPTIRQLAEALQQGPAQDVEPGRTTPFCLISDEDRARLPENVEDAYPLTTLQAGMIFHADFRADSAVYHDVFTFHIHAPLDFEVFQQAYQHMVDFHPALRTAFDLTTYSQPLQLVYQNVDARVEIDDLRDLDEVEQMRAVVNWIEAEQRRIIDLAVPEVLRVRVSRRSEESFQFSVGFHHATSDGWSDASLFTELFRRYLNLLEGKDDTEPPIDITYRDFVALEQQVLKSEESKQYWSEKLNENKFTRIQRWRSEVGDRPAEKVKAISFPIPLDLSEGVRALAQSLAVPIKSVTLAAHLKVISVLSGESDVLTGLSSSGRPETKDGERLVGLFLNTLPFRQKIDDGSWGDLITSTFVNERELMPHRRYPMAELRQRLGRRSLFEVSYNFIHFHVLQGLQKLEGMEVLSEGSFAATDFPILVLFSLHPATSQLRHSIFYDPTHFSERQIRSIGAYYSAALRAMIEDPNASHISQRWLASEEVVDSLLAYWKQQLAGATACELPVDRPRGNSITHERKTVTASWEEDVLESVAALCRHERRDPLTVLLAVLGTLLQRYTQQTGFVVGVPLHATVVLPLRLDLSGNPTFAELLERVDDVVISARAHADVPFDRLQEDLFGDPEIGGKSLVSVSFSTGETARPSENNEGTLAREEIAFYVRENAEGTILEVSYDPDLFDEATIVRMQTHFESLIRSIAGRAGAKLNDLSILTDAELKQRPARRERKELSSFMNTRARRAASGVDVPKPE